MDKFLKDQHIQLFCEDDLKTDIYIKNGKVEVKKYDNSIFGQLFLMDEITLDSIKRIFETRIFSENRPDKQILLNNLNLDRYDVYDIVRKTHGSTHNDNFWFKFDDEYITYKDIKLGNV